ncbi:hypothetical protein [Inconstantimicrobium mannanitabidum]|uniref:Uncharacterized protein n=1 Tax=Inconstantimicrobium mannanitabidum TaxID=1604901 RepID=A0ACB5R913_9CLOT|nr:hypothetical protein [Clostridium sp. TW13]GKX65516.1 hypothetical protein rsdtw13_07740 [Clostridium sp. TW13]
MKHIFYVHTGNAEYLQTSLRCAKIKNPNCNIVLLGDKSNDVYDFVEHAYIDEYSKYANEFKKIYIHLSSNPYEYELLCIQRWFNILEYMEKKSIFEGYYQDSDVILDYDINKFKNEGKIYYCGTSANECFFTYEMLKRVCDFIVECYSYKDKNEQFFNILSYIKHGGICDMTLFMMFANEHRNITEDISVERDGSVFDICIHNYENYERIENKKKIYTMNGKLYVRGIFSKKFIKINAVHFQGKDKKYMNDFVKYMDLNSSDIKYFNYTTQKWQDEEENHVYISERVLLNIIRSYRDDYDDDERQKTIDVIGKYLNKEFGYNHQEEVSSFLRNIYWNNFSQELQINNKKIVGWGTGSGINLYREFFELNIDYLISSNKFDEGTEKDGLRVFSPNKLLEENIEDIYVVVLSIDYYDEIKDVLVEYGFREKANFIGLKEIIYGIDNQIEV